MNQNEPPDKRLKQENLETASNFLGIDEQTERWDPARILGEKYQRIKQQTELFKAFSDESRAEIFIFLMFSGGTSEPQRYTVSEVAQRFNLSLSTVSHHLQELRRVGIVKMERSGKERYYQLDLDMLLERISEMHRRLLMRKELGRANAMMHHKNYRLCAKLERIDPESEI